MQTLQQRKAKFWVVVPVIIIPLLTLVFWKFGGGRAQETGTRASGGFNLQLPEAVPENQDNWTKLDYYKKADLDSVKLKKYKKKDPAHSFLAMAEKSERPEEKVFRKIEEIEAQMQIREKESGRLKRKELPNDDSRDDDRLERAKQTMQEVGPIVAPDPEMDKLQEMVNTLAALEHPSYLTAGAQKDTSFSFNVSTETERNLLTRNDREHFYGLADRENTPDRNTSALIRAVVNQDQIIASGETVELRLLQPVQISEITLPNGTRIYALATIASNRLQLVVKGIFYDGHLLPVHLTAYDQTGIEGLAIKGTITGDAARQAAQHSIGNIGFNNLNPTIEGQIAEAGVQTAKTLFNRKIKIVTVQLQAGEELWFVDRSSRK